MCVAGEAAAAEEAQGLPGAEVPASALERLQQVPPYPRCMPAQRVYLSLQSSMSGLQ